MKFSEIVSVGSLDSCRGRTLRGWILTDDNDAVSKIRLTVNGEVLPDEPDIEERPDVVEVHGGNLLCGFYFDLSELELEPLCEIGAVHTESNYDFKGFVFQYHAIKAKYLDVLEMLVMPEFYRSKYTLPDLSNNEIIDHYLNQGIHKNFDPNPWFDSEFYIARHGDLLDETGIAITSYLENEATLEVSPSEQFNTSYYYQNYPDLKEKSGIFLHYVVHGRREQRRTYDCDPPNSVIEQVRAITEIEPECGSFIESKHRVVRYPQIRSTTYLPLSVLQKYTEDIDVIVTVPFISVGGADLISTFVLKALQERYGEKKILLVVTDHDDIEVPEWVSNESSVLVLQKYAQFQNDHEKVQCLHTIIGLLAPEKVININSATSWKLFTQYGEQLSSVIDLYAYLFCFDYSESGNKVGYITDHIRDAIPHLTKVFCDNKKIIENVQSLYGFPKDVMEKFAPVYVPYPDRIGNAWVPPEESVKKKILWIGRLSAQKGPEVLIEIATVLRDVEFHVYGPPGNSSESKNIVNGQYQNIIYQGVYSHLDEVPVDEFECYLSTSQWEGLPTILIQIMARGVPVVTSVVGGVEELATEQAAWLVRNVRDSRDYVNRIRFMLLESDANLVKVKEASKLVKERHTWSSFVDTLEQLEFVPAKAETVEQNGSDKAGLIDKVA